MIYLARSCPICGHHDTSTGVVSEVRGENQGWKEISESWRGLFAKKSFFTYGRCIGCGLLYCPTYFSEEQLGELYASMDANMNEVPSPLLEKTQLGYFNAVQDHCRLPGGYLELGPDVGYFTGLCAKAGNFDSYWLIEPNQQVWPELQALFSENSEVHLHSELEKVEEITPGTLSFAAAIHVMDHIIDPVSVLRMIREKMADNSAFMCVTHDERSLLARLLGSRWPAFCLQHPQLYNAGSIRALFRSAGFDVVSVRKSVNYFPLGFLMRQGLWATLRMDLKFLRRLDFFDVGLRLGNILTIAKPSLK